MVLNLFVKVIIMKKVIFITGASSGIGEATALKLLDEGYIVYGGSRHLKKMQDIKKKGAKLLEIDMTKEDTLEAAVKKIIDQEGRINVLFNNAGYGLYGTVEETDIDKARHQFEVNLFGLARLTQLVLPYMRKQKSGKIINTSSMGGKVYTPLGAWYHATKHALEGWSDSLRLELKQFGIDVVIIEPGGIKTSWGSIAADNIEKISQDGPYADFARKVADGLRSTYSEDGDLSPPSVIANEVSKAIKSSNPKTRYVAGKFARLLMFVRKWLGDKVYDFLIMRMAK
jgi:short-subunit dehydrogenase